ncbi:ROK family protein [Streptococcus hyointestinalis]|uniref:ROK family protein n=1 Tax=Streptococcus hyointestinalis TaxID=1337 RepID=UPI0013DEDB98|nr:ROK family protein [Streptococcus hyointestinalis]
MAKRSDSNKTNQAKVLEYLYRKQQSSRIDLARDTQLTPAAITHLTSHFIEENKIIETGDQFRIKKGSGRSRKVLTLNSDYCYFLGIEINSNGISSVLTNVIGKQIDQNHIAHRDYHKDDINATLIALIKQMLDKHSEKYIHSIGLAVPGHFDQETGTIVSNNHIWQHFNLSQIKKEISLPIVIDNNIECMALGEYLFNPLNTPDNYLFMHIGPGLFCSFFDSSRITSKSNFYIGEIGHTVVDINGPQCECGKRGCLQTYISTTWLIQYAELLYQSNPSSAIKNLIDKPEDITLETIITAYQLGDSFLVDKIDTGLKLLATSIANTLILYDANKVYINSDLLNHLDFKEKLLEQIREQLNFIPNKTDLEIEILPFDDYRGARGACALSAYVNYIKQGLED